MTFAFVLVDEDAADVPTLDPNTNEWVVNVTGGFTSGELTELGFLVGAQVSKDPDVRNILTSHAIEWKDDETTTDESS